MNNNKINKKINFHSLKYEEKFNFKKKIFLTKR